MESSSSPYARRPTLLTGLMMLLGCAAYLILTSGGETATEFGPGENPLFDAGTGSATAASTGGERSADGGLPGVYTAPVGRQLQFALRHKNRIQIDHEGVSQGGLDLEIEADWEWTVVDRRGEEILLAIRFTRLVPVGPAAAAPAVETMLTGLDRLCGLRLDLDGRVLGIQRLDAHSAQSRGMLKGLVTAYSFEVPAEDPLPGSWTRNQEDATGIYAAAYRRRDDGVVERAKLRYLSVGPEGEERAHSFDTVRGAVAFSAEAGWLRQADILEDLRMDFSEAEAGIEVASQVQGQLVLTSHRDIARDDLPAVAWEGPWSAPLDSAADSAAIARGNTEAIYRNELAGVTLDDLVQELERLIAAGEGDSYEAFLAWERLKWLITLEPKAIDALVAMVRADGLSEQGSDMLITALGGAGTPAAQGALVVLQGDASLMPRIRQSALVSMFQLGDPTAQTLQVLVGRGQRVGGGSELDAIGMRALGRLSRRTGDRFAVGSSSGSALDHLLSMEAASVRSGQTSVWLQALGNSRSPEVLQRAAPYLDSPETSVRKDAVGAFRHLRSREATTVLLERGLGDPDSRVRSEALDVLVGQDNERAVAAVQQAALHDADPMMRQRAIVALAEKGDPASRAVLQQAAAGDPEPELRKFAAKLLKGG